MAVAQIAVKGIVRGKVQGVWFRRFVQEQAISRSVSGYAENQPDGSVEVLLIGPSRLVGDVQQQVAVGPPSAEVTELQWTDKPLVSVAQYSGDFLVR